MVSSLETIKRRRASCCWSPPMFALFGPPATFAGYAATDSRLVSLPLGAVIARLGLRD